MTALAERALHPQARGRAGTGAGLARSSAWWLRNASTRPLRRALARGRAPWLSRVPLRVRGVLDLDGEAVSPLRVELGGGEFPSPGYVHVDHDWRARHLEHVAPLWDLPFGDGEVHDLLAVHVLEHVHPGRVAPTLAEWRRVLRPGGTLQVHVPNGAAVFEAFTKGSAASKWALMTAVYGYGTRSGFVSPGGVSLGAEDPDHRAIYDFALLAELLAGAGFGQVEDLSELVTDRHTEGWRPLVEHLSLVVRARRLSSEPAA